MERWVVLLFSAALACCDSHQRPRDKPRQDWSPQDPSRQRDHWTTQSSRHGQDQPSRQQQDYWTTSTQPTRHHQEQPSMRHHDYRPSTEPSRHHHHQDLKSTEPSRHHQDWPSRLYQDYWPSRHHPDYWPSTRDLSRLDSFSVQLARLDFSLDQLSRRMEGVEAKMSRLETGLHARLDSVERVLADRLDNLTARLVKSDSDLEVYSKKVVNGIQELWLSSDQLRHDLSRTGDVTEKIEELGAKLETSFASLLVAQNAFIESCRRVQEEETHVYDLLQSVVDRSTSEADRVGKSLGRVLAAVGKGCNATTKNEEPEYDAESSDAEEEDKMQDYDVDYQMSESY